MKGWTVTAPGVCEYSENLPDPALDPRRPHDVVVDVEAAGPNFADNLMIDGLYQERPALPFTPGIEVAGIVADPNASAFAVGDRVVGLTRPGHGAWAEHAICDSRQLSAIPDDIATIVAVALHVNAQTAWFALHQRGALRKEHSVVVHAAAGGVGAMAVQLARSHGVRHLLGTASPSKLDIVAGLGAHPVDNRSNDWDDRVRSVVGGDVDVVIDPVGGAVFDASWRLLGFEGHYVVVGFASGDIPTIRANHALVKNVSVHGLYWTRYTLERPNLVTHAAKEIWELHRTGQLDAMISRHEPMDQAADLAADIAAGRTSGKCVASWTEELAS